jgi:hypothetical protein
MNIHACIICSHCSSLKLQIESHALVKTFTKLCQGYFLAFIAQIHFQKIKKCRC